VKAQVRLCVARGALGWGRRTFLKCYAARAERASACAVGRPFRAKVMMAYVARRTVPASRYR